MLLGLDSRVGIVSHLDVDEADYSGLQPVLRSLHHNYELLLHLGADLDGDAFLQFLRNWVLNKPAVEFHLGVLDQSTVLVREWKLVTVILSENLIAIETFLL